MNGIGFKEERRRGPDLWISVLEWLGIIGWLLVFIALLLVGAAKPQVETFFERHYNIHLRTTWDRDLLESLFYLMILGFCLSIAGLAINRKRHRRKNDEYRVSLILVGMISLLGIVAYLFYI